jgi:cell wall-associated NlpC family hydrolase
MMVAVRQHNMTSAGSIYGHVGIYIGNGQLMDNIGYIRTMSVYDWINTYNAHAINCNVRWGWGA